jgi:hypothetical protein
VYGYVSGRVLERTDPSGLNEAVPFSVAIIPFCTPGGSYVDAYGSISRDACPPMTGGGSGGRYGVSIDNNNNGLDDFKEFADYSFAHQRWREKGGAQDQWWQLMWALEHGVPDPVDREAIMSAFVFGRVDVVDFRYLDPDLVEPDDLAVVDDGEILINSRAEGHWDVADWSELAFTLAHEYAHLAFESGVESYASGHDQCIGERSANRYATNVTGYNLAGNYFPYRGACP